MLPNLLRILIVDDTMTYRMILRRVFSSIPGVEIVGTASNGEEALSRLASESVDMVFLDVEMPKMDGLETLHFIRNRFPTIGVVMISGANRNNADITIKALESGALDFISKPDTGDAESNLKRLTASLTSILENHRASLKSTVTRPAVTTPAPARPSPVSTPIRPTVGSGPLHSVDALAIGVSTGGPKALMEVIPRLPANLNVPVFIVQHMPPLFTASLADSLNRKSALTVKEAEDGERVVKNTVYIAPGGRHMVVHGRPENATIRINDDPPENSCRPAVDVLFRSVAETYGGHVLSAIMTGMGSDGANGVKALKAKGAYCLTQSATTCVVYGMPRAVDEARLSDESIPLEQLGNRMATLIQSKPVTGRRA